MWAIQWPFPYDVNICATARINCLLTKHSQFECGPFTYLFLVMQTSVPQPASTACSQNGLHGLSVSAELPVHRRVPGASAGCSPVGDHAAVLSKNHRHVCHQNVRGTISSNVFWNLRIRAQQADSKGVKLEEWTLSNSYADKYRKYTKISEVNLSVFIYHRPLKWAN